MCRTNRQPLVDILRARFYRVSYSDTSRTPNLQYYYFLVNIRGVASSYYRIDGVGLVGNDSGRFFLGNLQEGQWTAYSVMTDEADYSVTLEVSVYSNTFIISYRTTIISTTAGYPI